MNNNFRRQAILSIVVTLSLFAEFIFVHASDLIPLGEPLPWPPGDHLSCCADGGWPDNIVFNYGESGTHYPYIGYPMRGSLYTGLNDTISLLISFENPLNTPYSLTNRQPEKWFKPRVYQDLPSSNPAYLLRDSTELGYRVRGWTRAFGWGFHSCAKPDTLPRQGYNPTYALCLDVWDLPENICCLCIDYTSSVPSDFKAYRSGYVYEYRKAHSLADSVNAYEACYWRAEQDSNLSAMEFWSDKILEINPNSIPGWWIKADYYIVAKDTANAKIAFDKALSHLANKDDRALAGNFNTPMQKEEKEYREWLQVMIARNREELGP